MEFWCAGEDVGHYGGSYKVTYDLYKKFGENRLLDTPICGMHPSVAFCYCLKAAKSITGVQSFVYGNVQSRT